jgi:hypothetical protein
MTSVAIEPDRPPTAAPRGAGLIAAAAPLS